MQADHLSKGIHEVRKKRKREHSTSQGLKGASLNCRSNYASLLSMLHQFKLFQTTKIMKFNELISDEKKLSSFSFNAIETSFIYPYFSRSCYLIKLYNFRVVCLKAR